jgi:hypothetical protein
VAVTVLVVLARNVEPEGGVEVTVTLLQVSDAVIVHDTTTLESQVKTTMLLGQRIVGGVVSTTVIVCVQTTVRPRQSVYLQTIVITCGQVPFVDTLPTVTGLGTGQH